MTIRDDVMLLVLARLAAEGRDIAFVPDDEMDEQIKTAISDWRLATDATQGTELSARSRGTP